MKIIGVGFFDWHVVQTGRAPSNIEIDPVLAINFNPGTPQLVPTQLAPTCTLSRSGVGRAAAADDLTNQVKRLEPGDGKW